MARPSNLRHAATCLAGLNKSEKPGGVWTPSTRRRKEIPDELLLSLAWRRGDPRISLFAFLSRIALIPLPSGISFLSLVSLLSGVSLIPLCSSFSLLSFRSRVAFVTLLPTISFFSPFTLFPGSSLIPFISLRSRISRISLIPFFAFSSLVAFLPLFPLRTRLPFKRRKFLFKVCKFFYEAA